MSARPVLEVGVSDGHKNGDWMALTTLLEQLRDLMALVSVDVYRAQPAAPVSGSIGAHVRHTLDHVAALLNAVEGGDLQYDHRARGTTLEIDPVTAVNEIDRLLYRFSRSSPTAADRAITFSQLIDPDRPAEIVRSTVAREYAFVIQHTIHHCALIALLLDWQRVRVPYGFGMAPSTRQAHARAS